MSISGGAQLLNAQEILHTQLGLGSGMTFADLGIGSSAHFLFPGADLVGPEGKVYAVDILKSVLSAAQSRAQAEGKNQIAFVWSDLEVYGGAKEVADHSVDRLCLINLLFETSKDEHVFNEANRMLKPGGKAVVIDWNPGEQAFGPKAEQRTSLDKVRQMAKLVQWKEISTFEPSQYHFGIVFEKQA